jgi:hypothetical protein
MNLYIFRRNGYYWNQVVRSWHKNELSNNENKINISSYYTPDE